MWASLRHGNAAVLDDGGLSAGCCGALRGGRAWWCGTGGGSGPLRGRPGGATARSDSARFSASSPEPAQWLPESEEGDECQEKHRGIITLALAATLKHPEVTVVVNQHHINKTEFTDKLQCSYSL